jgi:N-acetylglucosaminyldiphosphoundecaprenol N-acetyl-beta-D-mannosaminyltransferase
LSAISIGNSEVTSDRVEAASHGDEVERLPYPHASGEAISSEGGRKSAYQWGFHPLREIAALHLVATNQHAAAENLCALARHRAKGYDVHLVNAFTVALSDKYPDYRAVLTSGAINLPDGKPLTWFSNLTHKPPKLKQVRGPRLLLEVCDLGRNHGVSHYFLGSTPEVLDELQRRLHDRYPGIDIVGAESPPFRPLTAQELEEQDRRIQDSGASIVWVGLGTPKQDVEAQRLADRLPVVAIAVGAAFDFAAGTLAEAPEWVTTAGLEWLFRLSREPRRLWRRYLFGNVRFIVASLRGLGVRR